MWPLLFLAMASDRIMPAEPLPDPVLAEHRGGFSLPGGIDIGLAVRTQTAIDGKVVLATVFTIVEGAARFTSYVPRAGESVAAPTAATAGASQGQTSAPTLTFDVRGGISVLPGQASPAFAIGGSGDVAKLPDGLVEATPGTASGAGLRATTDGALKRIELTAAGISISHLAGSAFGSAIANSGSDRTIDTTTSIGIDLRNAGPDNLGSTFLQVGNIVTDAMTGRIN